MSRNCLQCAHLDLLTTEAGDGLWCELFRDCVDEWTAEDCTGYLQVRDIEVEP